jgi:hypothetical protein
MQLELVRRKEQPKMPSKQQPGERVSGRWLRPATLFSLQKGQRQAASMPRQEPDGQTGAELQSAAAPKQAAEPVTLPGPEKPPLWRVGLLVTASAFCGGIAVVLWNRRLLARMRDSAETSQPTIGQSWDDSD